MARERIRLANGEEIFVRADGSVIPPARNEEVQIEITVKYKGKSFGSRLSEYSGNPLFATAIMKDLTSQASEEIGKMMTPLFGDIQRGLQPDA